MPAATATRVCLPQAWAGKCYSYSTTATTFDEADLSCSDQGGALVLYRSHQEQLAVENHYFFSGEGGGVVSGVCVAA